MPILCKCIALIVSLSLAVLTARPVAAGEFVRFTSAQFQLGPLTARRLAESGAARRQPPILNGYLYKPEKPGRRPAVVYLHGCAGLSKTLKAGTSSNPWFERLTAWGYIVLVVDSFTTRGVRQTCTEGIEIYRVEDALGALDYLARQDFVDPGRIAVLGFSAGGIATLGAVDDHAAELFEPSGARFKAAVAFYPICRPSRKLVAPTLILIGADDDWSPADKCRELAKEQADSGAAKLIIYPHARHGFDIEAHRSVHYEYGHALQYDPAATADAIERVRAFLAQQFR